MVKVKEDMTGWKMWEHGILDSRITVIKQVEDYVSPKGKHRAMWLCECNCEKHTIFITLGNGIRTGHVKSCGCWELECHSTHKSYKERLYKVWSNMKLRCNNPNHKQYYNYGGRGIKVCDEWNNDYLSFKKWAYENGYDENASKGQYTIERIDVNGNYCPENCCWKTHKEQQFNKRNNHKVEYDGKLLTLTEWGELTGFGFHLIQSRLKRGWSIEKALTTPVKRKSKYKEAI